MGKIIIEEWETVGDDDGNGPIYSHLVTRNVDVTTGSSAESIVTKGHTSYISVRAVEDHRVSIGGDETDDAGNYIDIIAGDPRIDLGLHAGGDEVFFRTEA